MSEIIKIALSGGPCSGKTSCIDSISSHYMEKGIPVFVCEESATQVIANGVSRDDMLSFETAVALNQLKLENAIEEKLSDVISEKVIVIYDRGLTDCFGYVDDENALCENIGISRVESWSRYDAVLILESATDYQPTSVRTESEDMAKEYADRVMSAWLGHPHLRYVKSFSDFNDKIEEIFGEIDCIVNDVEIEKKYLIDYPNFDALAKYNPVKSDIEQVYLLSDIGSHRIRKRTTNGVTICFETIKIRITESMCTEIERVISIDEYNVLLQNADPQKMPIIKSRYCFLYLGQYFELDVFTFWDDKAFVELEIRNEEQIAILPPEISVIKDVSDDKHYKNNYLAKSLYKDSQNENS